MTNYLVKKKTEYKEWKKDMTILRDWTIKW